MTWTPVDPASLALDDHRRELVMVEEVLRQRLEFWNAVRTLFTVGDTLKLERRLYRAPSGGLYEIVFTGRTDEPFPSGMEFWYLAEGFTPLPSRTTIDLDLWALARDIVSEVEATAPQAASVQVFEQFLPRPTPSA
jgi:hypothetical protein